MEIIDHTISGLFDLQVTPHRIEEKKRSNVSKVFEKYASNNDFSKNGT